MAKLEKEVVYLLPNKGFTADSPHSLGSHGVYLEKG